MSTFLEFYRALLRFVNFKLFTDLGQKYPPEYFQKQENKQRLYAISEEFKDTPEMKKLTQKEEHAKK